MKNAIARTERQETALERERQQMRKSVAQLERVPVIETQAPNPSCPMARIIFAADLTASREWSLDKTLPAIAGMFAQIGYERTIAIKFIYYRGANECKETPWVDESFNLVRYLANLKCAQGETQIGRVLRRSLRDFEQLSAVIFVGDHCEEEPRELEELAARLGRCRVPIFIFQECGFCDRRARDARPLFKRLAQLSGGIYAEFDRKKHRVLHEVLWNLAAYASSTPPTEFRGFPRTNTPEGKRFWEQLQLGS